METKEWVCAVYKSVFLNLLFVSHYHHTHINTICVHHLLTLVHDGCLWLGESIHIMKILIHKITQLTYKGKNPAKEFGGKTREKDLGERMKRAYGLLKKSQGYSILSITGHIIQFATQILAARVTIKCHADEVSTSVVFLTTQCTKYVQFNWVRYLCEEFLANYEEV